MRKFFRKRNFAAALLLTVSMLCSGCTVELAAPEPAETPEVITFATTSAEDSSVDAETDTGTSGVTVTEDDINGVTVTEDGFYDSKEEVALYLHLYGKLPGNYMTKKQARKQGWPGGSLDSYIKGKCIGGDYFGNMEGLLPEDKEYHECDIDTIGRDDRGRKRIIYSDDGYIYYTEDHYRSFELLYEP